ncbi:MAG: prepilin-type N-terminal cleavage/methylation domain-containing protein [Dehalococcoidia bacterium]|nr:MAG: prepilin-type N-terminal cleavage/methylation domain-containing protein [Dehalococcoidia bacterium]
MPVFIKKYRSIIKEQSGFSLVELLTALAISSIIVAGLAMTIFQLYRGHAQSSGEMDVVRQVQQTGYHMSRDTQMAREVTTNDDPSTTEVEILKLTWYWYYFDPNNPADRDGEGNRVIYTLEEGKLYRNFYFADVLDRDITEDDYVLQSTTYVARHIDEITCVYNGITLNITVTASVLDIAGLQEETRIYEVKPRPDVFF